MFWGAFAAKGTSLLDFINCKINADKNVDLLRESLLPEAPLITSGDYIFEWVNSSMQFSKSAELQFEDYSVNLFDWTVNSPDFNPV